MLKGLTFHAFSLKYNVFIILINVKMHTLVGVLICMSIIYILCTVELSIEKLYILGARTRQRSATALFPYLLSSFEGYALTRNLQYYSKDQLLVSCIRV